MFVSGITELVSVEMSLIKPIVTLQVDISKSNA